MRWRITALALLAALGIAGPARADGDPASDILLAQDVFSPYAPRVSKPVARALDRVVGAAARAGWPVKVALIQAKADLGAYPQLLGRPQRYADLLAVEISFDRKPHILTVMPNGFGGANLGPDARAVLAGVAIDRGASSDGLALGAARAVARLATAAGHPVQLPRLPAPATDAASGGSSAAGSAALFLAPVLVLAAVGGGAVLRTRRRAARTAAANAR